MPVLFFFFFFLMNTAPQKVKDVNKFYLPNQVHSFVKTEVHEPKLYVGYSCMKTWSH